MGSMFESPSEAEAYRRIKQLRIDIQVFTNIENKQNRLTQYQSDSLGSFTRELDNISKAICKNKE